MQGAQGTYDLTYPTPSSGYGYAINVGEILIMQPYYFVRTTQTIFWIRYGTYVYEKTPPINTYVFPYIEPGKGPVFDNSIYLNKSYYYEGGYKYMGPFRDEFHLIQRVS